MLTCLEIVCEFVCQTEELCFTRAPTSEAMLFWSYDVVVFCVLHDTANNTDKIHDLASNARERDRSVAVLSVVMLSLLEDR